MIRIQIQMGHEVPSSQLGQEIASSKLGPEVASSKLGLEVPSSQLGPEVARSWALHHPRAQMGSQIPCELVRNIDTQASPAS